MTEEKRVWKGTWVPKSIWVSKDLTWMEKCLWAEISNLDAEKGCFASNEYLAGVMGTSSASIANMISSLRKNGLIKDISFDGRRRFIKAVEHPDFNVELSLTSQSDESSLNPEVNPDLTQRLTIDTRLDSKIESPISPKGELAKTVSMLKVDSLFNRRSSTGWSRAELKAWKHARSLVESTDDESWRLLTWFYSIPKEDKRAEYRRTDMAALLNNWHAEIEKARRNKTPQKTFNEPPLRYI